MNQVVAPKLLTKASYRLSGLLLSFGTLILGTIDTIKITERMG